MRPPPAICTSTDVRRDGPAAPCSRSSDRRCRQRHPNARRLHSLNTSATRLPECCLKSTSIVYCDRKSERSTSSKGNTVKRPIPSTGRAIRNCAERSLTGNSGSGHRPVRGALLTEPGGSGQGPIVHRVNIVIKGQRRRATGPPLAHVHGFRWQLLWPFCGRTIGGSLGLHR